MRFEVIRCDWCDAEIKTHFVSYHHRHAGPFFTHDGARYDFDFCNDECLDEWRSASTDVAAGPATSPSPEASS